MSEESGTELAQVMLDRICRERQIQRQQKIRDDINSQLGEIAGNWIPHSESVTRPYGVEQEGQAYDVWHHILQNVTDPSEIENLWKVSGMFREILRGKYIETTLAKVVNLILEKHPSYVLPDQDEVIEDPEEELDAAIISTFGNTRLISKHCNKSLGNTYSSAKFCEVCLELETIEMVETICERLQANPSIATSSFLRFVVHIDDDHVEDIDNDDDIDDFHQAITDLLGLIGHRIHYFQFRSSLDTSQETYECLREWVLLMPNLEHLSFRLVKNYNYDDDDDDNEHRNPAALEEIGPFPNLPTLKGVEELEYGIRVLPSTYVHRILEASPGIQNLMFTDRVREHSPLVLGTLSSLTCIRISLYPSLLQLRNLPWKLNKLILLGHWVSGEWFTRITVSSCTLFSFLKQFEETLEHLELEMVDVIYCSCSYLSLRNVKTLSMELHKSYENLNFLLSAEKLEILKVRIGKGFMWNLEPEDKLKRIITGSFCGKSVWVVFPYLKRFQLRTTDYSEEDQMGAMIEEFKEALEVL